MFVAPKDDDDDDDDEDYVSVYKCICTVYSKYMLPNNIIHFSM